MARPQEISADLNDVLNRGATARQLGLMFRMGTTTVEQRLAPVQPAGMRDGTRIYPLAEAAPYLCRPLSSDAALARAIRTNHKDLPPMLVKEYWDGQKRQLEVRQQIGELFTTRAVHEYFGTAFREVRTEVQLWRDVVQRDTILPDDVSETLDDLIESLLRGIQNRVRAAFEGLEDDPIGRDASSVLEYKPEDPLADI